MKEIGYAEATLWFQIWENGCIFMSVCEEIAWNMATTAMSVCSSPV